MIVVKPSSIVFKNPTHLPCLFCLAPIPLYLALFALPLPPLCLAPKKPNNDHSNVIISIITILSVSPLSSPSLCKSSNKAQNPTQLYQTLNGTLQTKILLQKQAIWAEWLPLYYSSPIRMGLFQKGSCASSTASSRSNSPSSLLPLEPHCHTLRRLYFIQNTMPDQCLMKVIVLVPPSRCLSRVSVFEVH